MILCNKKEIPDALENTQSYKFSENYFFHLVEIISL